ncbi:MAG: YdeI/OmpD-associated family protein [Pelolinea sp.]|nr:YdeI/OmpD-associated family protein [Pelolinea sp.]
MILGKTVYFTDKKEWRTWLAANHKTEKEIWLVYFLKKSGKPSLAYNDAVDEALCFGWIDSTVKKIDDVSNARRFTPRWPNSPLSDMNKERVRRLIQPREMTPVGLATAGDLSPENLSIPADILKAFQADEQTWQKFSKFPESYQRIRIGWIVEARKRPAEFEKRLKYFLKMTARNKKFGMVQ